MNINHLLYQKNLTKYKLSKISGVPFTVISEISTGKSKLMNCTAGTVYKLAKALDITMEDLLAGNIIHSQNFEAYKSNICHQVKDMGDINFIITILEADEIRNLYLKQRYLESLYLLAMVDYLSRENNLPACNEYNDIRKAKLKETIYPASILTMCAILNSNTPKEESKNEAIPEFMRFNIVESEIRNVC